MAGRHFRSFSLFGALLGWWWSELRDRRIVVIAVVSRIVIFLHNVIDRFNLKDRFSFVV